MLDFTAVTSGMFLLPSKWSLLQTVVRARACWLTMPAFSFQESIPHGCVNCAHSIRLSHTCVKFNASAATVGLWIADMKCDDVTEEDTVCGDVSFCFQNFYRFLQSSANGSSLWRGIRMYQRFFVLAVLVCLSSLGHAGPNNNMVGGKRNCNWRGGNKIFAGLVASSHVAGFEPVTRRRYALVDTNRRNFAKFRKATRRFVTSLLFVISHRTTWLPLNEFW